MKILLLDAGNTRLKWAIVDHRTAPGLEPEQKQLSLIGNLRYDDLELEVALKSRWSDLPDIDRVILASVADSTVTDRLLRFIQQRWGLTAEIAQATASAYGIVNAYTDPERLGVDRWLALIATRRMIPEPACIVDCGSAITIDRLDAHGHHQGGLILPGLTMQRQALATGTAGINAEPHSSANRGDDESPETDFQPATLAQSTADAVTGGILTAVVAAIDRSIDEIDRRHGASHHILTGGDGPRLQALLSGQWIMRPYLVLEGLAIVAEDLR